MSDSSAVLQCIGDTCTRIAHGVGAVSAAVAPYSDYVPVVGQAVGIASTVLQKREDKAKMQDEIKLIENIEAKMKRLLDVAKKAPYKVCSLSALENALSLVRKRIDTDYAAEGKKADAFRTGWPEYYRAEVRGDMIMLQTAATNVLLELQLVQGKVTMAALEENRDVKDKMVKELTQRCIMFKPEEA